MINEEKIYGDNFILNKYFNSLITYEKFVLDICNWICHSLYHDSVTIDNSQVVDLTGERLLDLYIQSCMH